MNTPDQPPDEMENAYRTASEGEAGRPGAATRAAILAEARAAALRRTPAANDSRYVWRAAAGVAVLGVAVLLWQQANHKLSPDLTVATAERPSAARQASEVELKTVAPPASPEVAASTGAAAVADMAAAAPQASADKAAEPTAKAELEVASVNAQETRERADAAVSAAGALSRAAPDYQALLQREFPEAWRDAVTPRIAWLIMDSSGKAVRKGTASKADMPPGEWTYIDATTASGRSLQLAVMQAD